MRQADAVLVFVATRAMAEELSLDLGARGIQAAALSGDVPQKDREKLVARLKSGGLDVIIATDVAARGLDVERVGLVVNYDVPRESDTYVHRIGRTGRAGREGEALTFITSRELPRLRRIQKATQAHLEEVKIPTSWEVSRFNAERLLDAAQQRVSLGNLDVYADVLEEYRASREDADTFAVPTGDAAPHEHTHSFVSDGQLLAALLALGIRDAGSLDRDVPDIISDNIASSDKSGSKKKKKTRKSRDVQDGYTRYRVEVGHRDKVRPGAIVGALANEGGLSGSLIGSIDIYPTFSLVEIAGDIPSETWERLSRIRVSGRQLRISRDRGPVARHEDTGNGKENRSDLSLGRRSKKGRDKARGRKGSHNFKSQKKKRNRR
ncbi:MAG: DbpA RNA binding domain-containing protein [Actinomycetaceae bacterium]|nr:DbpA RNA binding domain-containing protein [Actinomycetaceae bacterium]